MIVSINQPAYLPWLGYFHRIMRSDLHIVLDHVQFEKNSVTNRNKVRTSQGWCWLTVPLLTKGKFGDLHINNLQIDNVSSWSLKHEKTLRMNYSKAPHFVEYQKYFQGIYEQEWKYLMPLLNETNSYLLEAFEIKTPLLLSSTMKVEGEKDELILNLCQAVGATTYLSGPFGRNYLRESLFKEAGIKVVYHDYQHPVYKQAQPGFEPFMSAVDLLFNYGTQSCQILEDHLEVAL